MRRFHYGLTTVSSLVFMMSAPAAFAGNCGVYGGQNCNPGVVYNGSGAPVVDPLTINVRQPLGDLRSVNIHTAPTVSITRLYGQQTLASVGDNPNGFRGGCHPSTTSYCRQDVGTPVNVTLNRPVTQPVIAAPIVTPRVAPIVQPTVRFGGGYNPTAHLPRQYGENTFTPGIAHVPTSYVDRNPATAARLLASGVTQSYNTLSYSHASPYAGSSVQITSPVSHSVSASGPTTPVDANGGYWEQVSGPTLFGDTLATQVICRRQAPVQQVQHVQQQVVRPIVAVPTPVPVYCEPSQVKNRYGVAVQPANPAGFNFNGAPQGRWTY